MRRLPLPLLAAGLLSAAGIACATSPTRIPDAAVKTAEQLRDKALLDDTGYRIVESAGATEGAPAAGTAGTQ